MGCYKVILDCAEANVPFYEKCGLTRKEVQMVRVFHTPRCIIGCQHQRSSSPQVFPLACRSGTLTDDEGWGWGWREYYIRHAISPTSIVLIHSINYTGTTVLRSTELSIEYFIFINKATNFSHLHTKSS